MSDKDLLHGLYQAVNLYYNYTGKTPCLNLSSEATPELPDDHDHDGPNTF
jgi:hypothetical protein